ncbi:SbmA/BacA-like family transporter [Shewanella surugensis]|uniref:ABC transmembrane type-1 domain-containing protein n=1 Tax=Shewanella surugensis TaxID=212020 RepID=A0ABT0LBA4_9GAMM|nr:SbmA/BacA-like family transporter [Shewanella surugensis]MCL1124973.1 hypothetical protein [Shewanella surugensis]
MGTIHISGYLVWIALMYSFAGTYITHKIGKKLIGLNFKQQREEADFRFNAVRIRANAENIALYQAQDKEKTGILRSFSQVIDITLQVINREKMLLYFTAGFNQISSAFSQVENSLSFFVNAYTDIAQWYCV